MTPFNVLYLQGNKHIEFVGKKTFAKCALGNCQFMLAITVNYDLFFDLAQKYQKAVLVSYCIVCPSS